MTIPWLVLLLPFLPFESLGPLMSLPLENLYNDSLAGMIPNTSLTLSVNTFGLWLSCRRSFEIWRWPWFHCQPHINHLMLDSCIKWVINGVKEVNIQMPTYALSVNTLASHSSTQKANENGTQVRHNLSVWIPQPVYGAWVGLASCSCLSSLQVVLPEASQTQRVLAKIRVCVVLWHNNLPHCFHVTATSSSSPRPILCFPEGPILPGRVECCCCLTTST